ncbi:glycoside hydrolase family 32 protein [Paenibacillus sp. LMG 31460]|uniref:Glycoside hydrolase family 32 protein n=1 Tax=Paenibacillus germinis TaxID=2654979 RepID=A0ABX1Z1H8_9BACL|nr:glycoside hydrolase family 32 protein [Paenibacillus germinis]NOU87253.1 glycoside hydrolase family 32 protein [Paenibacillus germinis]
MITANNQTNFRPQLHFTPRDQWMNDPNGMVFYEGEYHLFYQYHPESTVWGPMHWGHAVSQDLVHWEHLPIALAPDEHGAIFSGSVVVDKHDTSGFFAGKSGLVAIFTHHDTKPGTDLTRQRQSLAYSTDRGRTWTKYANNPVLIEEALPDFRDPKVFWFNPQQSWVMVIAAGDTIRFYKSPNLKEWTHSGEFGVGQGSHDGVWECPDLFELPVDGDILNRRWVLIVSIGEDANFLEGSRTQCFIGSFNGDTFVSEESPAPLLWLDHGRDNYAGVTWSDVPEQQGRRLFIGWMNNWKYANVIPTSNWRGAMTLPRELTLTAEMEGVRLLQKPIPELQAQRRGEQNWAAFELSNSELTVTHGDLLEIIAEFEFDDELEFGLKLRASETEETILGYSTHEQLLFIDRSRSGAIDFHADFACKHSALLKAETGNMKLHIFVDRSSIEAFANDGKLVMTDQIFPLSSSTGIKLYAKDGSVKVKSLTIHTLNSIFD